jgi:hypothetical protein
MKIRILKSFPSIRYGNMQAGEEYQCDDSFAEYCINRMGAAMKIEEPKPEIKPGIKLKRPR